VRAPLPNADGSSTMRIGQKTVTVSQRSETRKVSVMGAKQVYPVISHHSSPSPTTSRHLPPSPTTSAPPPPAISRHLPLSPTISQAVSMPPELPATLADVRSDASSTDWCLCGFEGAALQRQPYVPQAATRCAGGCHPACPACNPTCARCCAAAHRQWQRGRERASLAPLARQPLLWLRAHH
jgi:hypothetical protein